MTASYRVKFANMFTDVDLDEFALSGISFEHRISAAGMLTAGIPIARGDRSLAKRMQAVKSSGGSAVYVYRNGALWWDGLLWTKEPASDDHGNPTVALSASSVESYLDRVHLLTDLPPLLGADQLDIARSFITHLQTDPHANLGITFGAETSGIIRDRTLYQAASRPSYLQMVTDLAGLDAGFEFQVRSFADPTTGIRTRRLRLGYPTITSAVVHNLAKPGAILNYQFAEDGSRGATYLTAQGASATSSVHTDTAALAAGYPRLDATTTYSTISDTAALEAHAAADLARSRVPVLIPQVRILLDAAPDITPDALGDTVNLKFAADEYFPDPTVVTCRLVGMTVNVPERGAPETADLVFN